MLNLVTWFEWEIDKKFNENPTRVTLSLTLIYFTVIGIVWGTYIVKGYLKARIGDNYTGI